MNLKDDKAPILNIFNSVIKGHNLNSQYFLDWLLINFEPTDLCWSASEKTSTFNKKSKNSLSVRSQGAMEIIGTYEIKNNSTISYQLDSNLNFENDFLNDLIKNTISDFSQEDKSVIYDNSIFGPIRLRVARNSNLLISRILFVNWPKIKSNIHYYINPLKIIIESIDQNLISLTDEQKQEIDNLYYSFIQNKIEFNDLEKSLFLLNEYERISKVIDY